MDTLEMEKGKAHIIVKIVEYLSNAVVSKVTIRKIKGNIIASSFEAGEELAEKASSFDTYTQIINDSAEIITDKNMHYLRLGEGIIIPAHASHIFNTTQ